MRAISGQNWGANKNILLTVYRNYIRSIIDYACLAYNFSADYLLKKLDTIQYKALMISTGGMRGTSLAALLSECGEKSLNVRRKEIILKFLCKIDNSKSYPVQSIIHKKKYPTLEQSFISKYGEILENFYKKFDLDIDRDVYNEWQVKSPHNLKADTSLSNIVTKTMDKNLLLGIVTDNIDKDYSSYTRIYVDASTQPDGKSAIALNCPGNPEVSFGENQ